VLIFSLVPAFFAIIWIGLGRSFIAFLPLFVRILEILLRGERKRKSADSARHLASVPSTASKLVEGTRC
jgi:hypothetical protein